MLSYIIGKIISINIKSITLESNWIGYIINVSDPKKFEINKIKKIYLYKNTTLGNKNTFNEDYYGFGIYEEKELFLKLISLPGIGPKTALGILKNDLNIIKEMIINKNIDGLSSLNGINDKIAKIMTENISYIDVKISNNNSSKKIYELISALKSLGYDKNDIDFALSKNVFNQCATSELSDLISSAVKTIATNNKNESFIKAE